MKHSVFYLDDEATALDLFQQAFGHEYDVRTAATLAAARRMLAERPADIIISDQSMPEISGTEFLGEVARLYPASYRVMLTGSMAMGAAISEIASGVVQLFIPKPWELETMQQVLERASLQVDFNRAQREAD
ncbi:MAG: response regulator [Pyrinomonadaceae bacterium]